MPLLLLLLPVAAIAGGVITHKVESAFDDHDTPSTQTSIISLSDAAKLAIVGGVGYFLYTKLKRI